MTDARAIRTGAKVLAVRADSYLRQYHGVLPGVTVGVVARPSMLSSDDDGWLVNWGDGDEVRCSGDELVLSDTPESQSYVDELLEGATLAVYKAQYGGSPIDEDIEASRLIARDALRAVGITFNG